jgi:hypothetical protein
VCLRLRVVVLVDDGTDDGGSREVIYHCSPSIHMFPRLGCRCSISLSQHEVASRVVKAPTIARAMGGIRYVDSAIYLNGHDKQKIRRDEACSSLALSHVSHGWHLIMADVGCYFDRTPCRIGLKMSSLLNIHPIGTLGAS